MLHNVLQLNVQAKNNKARMDVDALQCNSTTTQHHLIALILPNNVF